MNTDELEAALYRAERRVLEIQAKLHRWAIGDRERRFDDLFNLVTDPAFLLVAWDRVRGNRGARTAGVDGHTAMSIALGTGVEEFLDALRSSLKQRGFRPSAGPGADDSQGERQAPSSGDRHHHRPGGPGVPETGAGADFRGGFRPMLVWVSPESPDT